MGKVTHLFPPRTGSPEVRDVASAIHRMNNEPGMADNPVWQDLCEYFNRRWPGNGWECPF